MLLSPHNLNEDHWHTILIYKNVTQQPQLVHGNELSFLLIPETVPPPESDSTSTSEVENDSDVGASMPNVVADNESDCDTEADSECEGEGFVEEEEKEGNQKAPVGQSNTNGISEKNGIDQESGQSADEVSIGSVIITEEELVLLVPYTRYGTIYIENVRLAQYN